jgi:DNA segregation ATPase FtsK/SpoIIIE-like protein
MKKVFYEKVGRRYVPVSEYDSDLLNSFSKGTHLVMTYPGGESRRYNIDPNYAALIAASRVAENAMSEAICRASEMRPHKKPITEKQRKAWENLAKAFDDDRYYVELPSAREIAEAGVEALQQEADQLMKHESVKHAYEQFLLVCKLVKENNHGHS